MDAVSLKIINTMLASPFQAPTDWQSLIRFIGRKDIGNVGERFVAQMLERHGLKVIHIGGNNEGFDIEVHGLADAVLPRPLLIEVKVNCEKKCVRDTWGSWHARTKDRGLIFDFIVMINLNVGLRVHIIPVECMRRVVYRHANGHSYSFRFGVTDDIHRHDVGLLTDGLRFNGAWHLVVNEVHSRLSQGVSG